MKAFKYSLHECHRGSLAGTATKHKAAEYSCCHVLELLIWQWQRQLFQQRSADTYEQNTQE